MNAKFVKSNAKLHLIPVPAKVWHQVSSLLFLLGAYIHLHSQTCLNYPLPMQVGIDMIGPLPLTKKGNKYIVTLVDYFSKWPEAAPLPEKTAAGVALFLYELFCRLVPKMCT